MLSAIRRRAKEEVAISWRQNRCITSPSTPLRRNSLSPAPTTKVLHPTGILDLPVGQQRQRAAHTAIVAASDEVLLHKDLAKPRFLAPGPTEFIAFLDLSGLGKALQSHCGSENGSQPALGTLREPPHFSANLLRSKSSMILGSYPARVA